GIKRVGDKMIECTDISFIPGCTMRLRGIPHDYKIMARGKILHSADIDRIPEQVDRRYSAGPLGNAPLGILKIDHKRIGIDIAEHGLTTAHLYHRTGCHKG